MVNLNWKIDLICVVPLDRRRVRERGYNQSVFIGRPLAERTGVRFSNKAIKKVRFTEPQVGLDYQQRVQNVKGAYLADHRIVTGKNILIVDDVVTTGTTLNSCAGALKSAYAQRTYGLTVARTTRVNLE